MALIAHPREFQQLREAREALFNPHPGLDRFDPDFRVSMRCAKCGKFAFGPRATMAEAMREHLEKDCPVRKTHENEAQLMRLFYPRQ